MGLHDAPGLLLALELDREAGLPGRRRRRTGRCYNHGLTPTWFDVPKAARDGLNVYIGESTGHKERPHGEWNTEGNRSMAKGVNKDWPGRAGYTDAYTTSYFATRQWVRAIRRR